MGCTPAAASTTISTAAARCSTAASDAANAGRLPRPLPQLVLGPGYGPLNCATANNSYATGSFDTALIESKGYKTVTPVIVTNSDDFDSVDMLAQGAVAALDPLLDVKKGSVVQA